MIPGLACIQAIRGFQSEKEIPLSPTLTVIYGENGRGKTSLCEGWHWLFTGEMLEGLEPSSELGSAGTNIHVELDPSMRLLSEDGATIISRSGEDVWNPASVPTGTSPVLLQYRLQKVLYATQKERRKFFEEALELEAESTFAQTLRRACQSIDPFDHQAWGAWCRAIDAVRDRGFVVPHSQPSSRVEQSENEAALMQFVSGFFGCEATPESIEQAMEMGAGEADISIEKIAPPISESLVENIEDAISAIKNIDAEAERALALATWWRQGLDFVKPPVCPFCGKETIDESTLNAIRQGMHEAESRHGAHREAEKKLGEAVAAARPIAKLDLDATRKHVQRLHDQLQELEIEGADRILPKLANLDEILGRLEQYRLYEKNLEEPEVFASFAPTVIEVARTWLDLAPHLETLRRQLESRRIRVHYMEAATSILQYHRFDREDFYRRLDAKPILAEIADAAPRAVEQLKEERLGRLANEILKYYSILRPDDPTPLEEIQIAEGVRGDIRILARSGGKVDHASALFSHSNANALGMAVHIARVLDAGHRIIVMDDPFQSLDDSNRNRVIQNLISRLLDNGIQVVVLTHERSMAKKLLNMYAEEDALGTALEWDPEEGAIPVPMYPDGDAQLAIVLDGLERGDHSEILKVNSALRKLIEGFCAEYLRAVGQNLPPSNRRNLGSYIAKLDALAPDIRPSAAMLEDLREWNRILNSGSEGMNELKAIVRDALKAHKLEKQLRPPRMREWKTIPKSQGIKDRCKRILGLVD